MAVRLNEHLERSGLLPESQFGFRKKQRNNRHDLHSTTASRKMPGTECGPLHDFVDLTKAFDTVSRVGLWKIMAKFGCPAKFIAMVR